MPDLGKGPLKCELLHGGTSNVVFTLNRGEQDMVLRRPPAVPPPGAEKGVLREARVLTALRDTEVPAPYCYGSCEDPEVIGAPFYVMEKVDGWAPNLRGDKIHNEPPFDKYALRIRHRLCHRRRADAARQCRLQGGGAWGLRQARQFHGTPG